MKFKHLLMALVVSAFFFSCEEKRQSILVLGDGLSKNETMLNLLSNRHSSYRWYSGGQDGAVVGDAARSLASFIGNKGMEFQNVILWVGIQDVWSDIPTQDTISGFLLIKDICRKHHKNLIVLTIPIYCKNTSSGHREKIDQIFELNSFIRANFKEVDVNGTYVWLRDDTTVDGLAMNDNGASSMSSYISLIVFEKNPHTIDLEPIKSDS